MFVFRDEVLDLDFFKEYTLIVPAVSVGNVGQLACDLLISTLKLEKIGYFNPALFLPIVGNNPFATSEQDKNVLSLSSEVFYHSQSKIAVLQIRSPVIKHKREEFQRSLLEWFNKCHFKELIILSSCHSFERTDEQLIGTPFRYLLTPGMEKESDLFSDFKWRQLEERNVGYGDRSLFIPGGGYTKSLFQNCCKENIPAVVLLLFCAEGDNVPEALTLISHLNQWKQYMNDNKEWKKPSSWVHMFGNQPPRGIF